MITKWGDEVDVLDKTVEECSELIHIIMKIKRFGLHTYHPFTRANNVASLKKEMEDVLECIEELKKEYSL